METDSAGQYTDYLRIRRHPRGKENDRNEYEQRTEHIHEIRYEVQIIIEDNGLYRCLSGHEIVHLLADVEDYHDSDNEQNRDKEGKHELLYYVEIKFLWKHSLKPCHYPFYRHVFPGFEISGQNVPARSTDQIQIEREIMFTRNHRGEHFTCDKKMPQIGLRVSPVHERCPVRVKEREVIIPLFVAHDH